MNLLKHKQSELCYDKHGSKIIFILEQHENNFSLDYFCSACNKQLQKLTIGQSI